MAAKGSTMRKCDTCGSSIDDTRNSSHVTPDDSTLLLNSCRNIDSKLTLCITCITFNVKDNRINNLKKSTEYKKPKTQNRIKTHDKKSNFLQKHKKWIMAVIFGVLLGSGIHYILFSNTWNFSTILFNNSNNPVITSTTLKTTLEKLSEQFPSLKKSFVRKVNGALLRLKMPGEPFIFLLLHDDSNKKNTDCLASYISIIAKENMFTKTVKSLWMNASEWVQHSSPSGLDLLHTKLIEPLEENEVLILENLQDLPWTLATSFHHLCDAINPKFAKAMYLLELRVDVDRLEELTEADKMVVAEQAMNTVWLDAPNSFRAALITRLTSYVDAVLLNSDDECPNSDAQLLQPNKTFIKISP